jgi:hypothetical protein
MEVVIDGQTYVPEQKAIVVNGKLWVPRPKESRRVTAIGGRYVPEWLVKATVDGDTIIIKYSDRDGDVTTREIDPIRFCYDRGALWLLAYCHLRCDLRTFRVTNISKGE